MHYIFLSCRWINVTHKNSVVHNFHLGPKTADRISIVMLDVFFFVLVFFCTVIQIVELLFIFLCWKYWQVSKKYFSPKRRTGKIQLDNFLLHKQFFLLCNLCNRLYIYFWKYIAISIEALLFFYYHTSTCSVSYELTNECIPCWTLSKNDFSGGLGAKMQRQQVGRGGQRSPGSGAATEEKRETQQLQGNVPTKISVTRARGSTWSYHSYLCKV